MIRHFIPSAGRWERGGGSRAQWTQVEPSNLDWNPQFLMSDEDAARKDFEDWRRKETGRLGFRDVTNSTNERTFLGAILPDFPCGHSAPVLRMMPEGALALLAVLNSFVFDWQTRQRGGGTHLIWGLLAEMALPGRGQWWDPVARMAALLNIGYAPYAPFRLRSGFAACGAALLDGERRRLRAAMDALVARLYGLTADELAHLLRDTDLPAAAIRERRGTLDPSGFWRVDRDKDPELRHTVLTLVAFRDLEEKIEAAGGDRDKGIAAFLSQNHGEGWMLPETLRLADYDLGHDDRAREHQPVASRLGSRFFDWQLLQTPEEREQETHLHARNLLGAAGYGELLAERIAKDVPVKDEEGDFGPPIQAFAARIKEPYTRRLLGDRGLEALVAELCHRAVPRRTQRPTFLRLLRSAGYLGAAGCLRVLDRLLDRKLISETEHDRWRRLVQRRQDPSANLLAAEPKHEFQLRSQRTPRKLFDD